MAAFVNQHSFVLLAMAALVGLSLNSLRNGFRPADGFALAALAGGLALAYLLLAPGPATSRQIGPIDAQIGAGQPVLLEFQSPY